MGKISDYEDIIALEHHKSKTHPHMSREERAAQFSPFAALKGYEDSIEEAARYTAEQIEGDEERVSAINACLSLIKEKRAEHPLVTLTYFKADKKKAGGAYITVTERVNKIKEYEKILVLEETGEIAFHDLFEIEVK